MTMENLKLTARTTTMGCGIYDAGDPEKCYTKLFVTDGGRVLPLNHRVITEEDIMTVYKWGRLEEREDEAASQEQTEADIADVLDVNDYYDYADDYPGTY